MSAHLSARALPRCALARGSALRPSAARHQEDGYEQQCRWCGVGGDLVGCDNCISSYCEDCITRNLGKRTLAKIKKNNDWHCFSCDGSPVAELRWEPVRVPCGRALGQLG